MTYIFSLGHKKFMAPDYLTHLWYAAPYFGLVLVSIWLFRRATKWEASLMLVGSLIRACDAFMWHFVLAQGTGLWPMPWDMTAPGAAEQLRLHQTVQTFFEKLGSWGIILFVVSGCCGISQCQVSSSRAKLVFGRHLALSCLAAYY